MPKESRRSALHATLIVLSWSANAKAFEIESVASDACHEEITLAALDRSAWPDGQSPPPLSPKTRILARDLAFKVPSAKADAWRMALVIGARFNDLHGSGPLDLPRLTIVHGQVDHQDEHCLRAPTQDGEEDADRAAIESCTRFIQAQLELALGEHDELDLSEDEEVVVDLAFQGPESVDVQRFAFRLGRALHALQDSFTHTFRSADGRSIRHVLNFSEWAGDRGYDAMRDGFHHLSALDQCRNHDPLVQRNVRLAEEASAALIDSLREGIGGRAGRLERAMAVVAQQLDYQPGCAEGNDWCDAAEPKVKEACALGHPLSSSGPSAAGWGMYLLLVAAAGLRRRRTKQARPQGHRAMLTALVMGSLVCLVAPRARAQTEPSLGKEREEVQAFTLSLAVAGAVDHGALAERLGFAYRFTRLFELGVYVEHNPWFSLESRNAVAGVLNPSLGASFYWFRHRNFSIRSTLYAGASVLLFDLVGIDRGTTGPYVAADLLGLVWHVHPRLALFIDPAEVALPIPQVKGVPFYYRQYRVALGLRWQL